MNQGHIEAGEVVDLGTLKPDMDKDASYALIKTSDMEVIRMVVPAGRKTDEHSVAGEVSFQCLEGSVQLHVGDDIKQLTKGSWVFLERKQPYSISGISDGVLLVTILFTPNS